MRIVPPGTQIVANDDVRVAETGHTLPGGAVGVTSYESLGRGTPWIINGGSMPQTS